MNYELELCKILNQKFITTLSIFSSSDNQNPYYHIKNKFYKLNNLMINSYDLFNFYTMFLIFPNCYSIKTFIFIAKSRT